MIAWYWLIAAFYAGTLVTMAVIGLCKAAGRPMPTNNHKEDTHA